MNRTKELPVDPEKRNPFSKNKMKGQEYIDELAGITALPDYMQGSLMEFANRIKFYIELELKELQPNDGLIALLCDAGRLGWEQIEWAHKPIFVPGSQRIKE